MKDLIIIGAGPAGLMTAYQAAKQGLRVTLVEMKKDISVINRSCSAQFVLDDGYEGEKLVVTDDELQFTRNGFSVPYTGAKEPIYHNYMISPNGTRVAFEYEDGRAEAIRFDKPALLKGLLEIAVQAGAEVLLNTLAISGEDFGDYVSLRVKSNGKERELSSRKLVIAEGVNCKLTEAFGLNEGRMLFGTPFICSYTVEGTHDIPHNSWIQYYGNVYHPFTEILVGESVESEDALEITVGGMGANKPDLFFEKLRTDSPLSPNLRDIKIIHKQACPVKSYLSLETPYKGNVLAIGDSAAHIEVINQGAIMCGFHAGNAIVNELSGKDGFEQYKRWWNGAFMFNVEDKMGQLQLMRILNIKANLADDEIDYVFGLLEGKRLRGEFNQYEVPKHFWQALKLYGDQIQAENPELYPKVQKIFSLV